MKPGDTYTDADGTWRVASMRGDAVTSAVLIEPSKEWRERNPPSPVREPEPSEMEKLVEALLADPALAQTTKTAIEKAVPRTRVERVREARMGRMSPS